LLRKVICPQNATQALLPPPKVERAIPACSLSVPNQRAQPA